MKDSRGIIYSSTLHATILALLIFGLPSFFHHESDPEPEAISVEILPIAPVSNVKPQEKVEDEKKPIAEKTVAKKAAPETKKEETKTDEPPPVPLPNKEKPIEKKKPEKKKPEKKKEDDPLKAVLNDVKEHAKVEEGEKPTQQKPDTKAKPTKSPHYDPDAPLTMSQQDAIRQQIEIHWNAPVGAKDAGHLNVSLHITMNQDGSVNTVELADDKARYYSDSFFRAAVDSAIRAVHQASPLKNLPADKYNVREGWSDIIMTFDLSDAVN